MCEEFGPWSLGSDRCRSPVPGSASTDRKRSRRESQRTASVDLQLEPRRADRVSTAQTPCRSAGLPSQPTLPVQDRFTARGGGKQVSLAITSRLEAFRASLRLPSETGLAFLVPRQSLEPLQLLIPI